VEPICRAIDVAQSTYYAAKTRPPSARALRDQQLMAEIVAVWNDNYKVYGVHTMWTELNRRGTAAQHRRLIAALIDHVDPIYDSVLIYRIPGKDLIQTELIGQPLGNSDSIL